MTLDEAIQRLSEAKEREYIRYTTPELIDALNLGIEALNEIKYYRNNPITYALKLLPGETEEAK